MRYILVMTLVMFLFPTDAMQRNVYDEGLDGNMDNQKICNSDSDSDFEPGGFWHQPATREMFLRWHEKAFEKAIKRNAVPELKDVPPHYLRFLHGSPSAGYEERPPKRRNVHQQGSSSSSACSSTDSVLEDKNAALADKLSKLQNLTQQVKSKLEVMLQQAIRAQEAAQKSKLDLEECCAGKYKNDKALLEARAEKHEIVKALKEVCATKEEKERALEEARAQIQEIKNQNVEQQKHSQQLQLEKDGAIQALKNQMEAEKALKAEAEKALEDQMDQLKCIICFEEHATFAMIPCGHKCLCEKHAGKFTPKVTPKGCKKGGKQDKHKCPICRENIKGKLKIFGTC